MPAVANPQAEVRLGLVLYGGVSLAIYMYGVVREIARLVHASRTGDRDNPYTTVLQIADVSAVVDIISGTSAGGINGVLLAKALATGADVGEVEGLWLEAGDFDVLLQPRGDPEPPSLLRSELMEEQLLKAFRTLDRPDAREAGLADVLDLFVSGTNLEGRVETVTDRLGQEVDTRNYRQTFHLRHRSRYALGDGDTAREERGYDASDFFHEDGRRAAELNERLMKVARTTSAFPAAFRPTHLDEALLGEGARAAWFADGGILHNRPFTETLSTIFNRTADVPVRRWLVSLDPDPEQIETPTSPHSEPSWLRVVRDATGEIPRYQSIAADLARLSDRNERVADMRQLLDDVEDSIPGRLERHLHAGTPEEREAFEDLLSRQVLYPAWTRMRAESVREDLTARIQGGAHLEDAGRRAVLASLPPFDPAQIDALRAVDARFELRRIYYLLAALPVPARRDPADPRLKEARASLYLQFQTVRDEMWTLWEKQAEAWPRDLNTAQVAERTAELLQASVPATAAKLAEIAAETREVCVEIEAEPPKGRAGHRPWQPLPQVFDTYAFRDMLVLPLERLGELGERDRIRFARISPWAATRLKKRPEDKIAGDALGHFGGFLDREWRENDILWGRLDAAEVLVRMLLEGKDERLLDGAVDLVQKPIAEEHMEAVGHEGNYREYLLKCQKAGAQSVGDLPGGRLARLALGAAEVFRNMVRRLERTEASGAGGGRRTSFFRWTGRALGVFLAFLHWPVTALFGESKIVRRAIAGLLFVVFLWGLANLVLDLVGVIDLPEDDEDISYLALLPYTLFALAWLFLRRTWHWMQGPYD